MLSTGGSVRSTLPTWAFSVPDRTAKCSIRPHRWDFCTENGPIASVRFAIVMMRTM